MPVNTRNERAAAINLLLGFGRVLPDPDAGAEDQADRQQTALSYPGILVTAFSTPATLNDLTTIWCQDYQPVLHAHHAVGSAFDDTTLVEADLAHAMTYDPDLNTAYALYISTEF
jgi:hypothetical protein